MRHRKRSIWAVLLSILYSKSPTLPNIQQLNLIKCTHFCGILKYLVLFWGKKAKIIITRWDRNLNFQSRLWDYITGHRFFPWSDLAVPSVWASPSVRAPNLPTFALTLRLRCIYAKPCWSFRSKAVGKENLFFRLRSSNASFIALSRSPFPKHLSLLRSLQGPSVHIFVKKML